MPANRSFRPAREDISRQAKATRAADLRFPVTDDEYGILFVFKEYNFNATPNQIGGFAGRGFSRVDASVNSSDTVFLPLPANIVDNFDIRVMPFDAGVTGEMISSIASQATRNGVNSGIIGSITQSIMNQLPEVLRDGSQGYEAIRGAISSLAGYGGNEALDRFAADANFLLRRALPGDIGRAVDSGTGTVVNPKTALAFEGVGLKRFSFDWTLAPKTEDETRILRSIIDTMKRRMLPSYAVGDGVLQRALLRYPYTVDVFFVGIDSDYYFYFKTGMINSFSANYTPNGVSILRGGRPASVSIQLSITETDIHTSEDYEGSSFVVAGPGSSE
jgi:hypothetical protein